MDNKTKTAIAGAIMAGSLALGSQVGKPNCDYVVVNQEAREEICLTAKQAEAIYSSMATSTYQGGFDQIKFSDPLIVPK